MSSFRDGLSEEESTSAGAVLGFVSIDVKPKKLAILEVFLVFAVNIRAK